LGFYFDGTGGYRYAVSGSEDRASFAANLARVAKSLRPADNGVTDRFSKMLVLFSEPVLSDIWDEASGGEPTAAPTGSSDLRALSGLSSYPEFDFACGRKVERPGTVRLRRVRRGVERVGYVYDEVADGHERFFNFRKSRTTPLGLRRRSAFSHRADARPRQLDHLDSGGDRNGDGRERPIAAT
jgi:hypothetical protein